MKKIYWLTVLTVLLGLLPCKGLEAADTYMPLIYNNYCSNQHLSLNFLAFGDSITAVITTIIMGGSMAPRIPGLRV